MSGQGRFYVLDHTGAVTACFNEAAPAVELAGEYAKEHGVADVVCGKRRKRFLASGRVYTVRNARRLAL